MLFGYLLRTTIFPTYLYIEDSSYNRCRLCFSVIFLAGTYPIPLAIASEDGTIATISRVLIYLTQNQFSEPAVNPFMKGCYIASCEQCRLLLEKILWSGFLLQGYLGLY